MTPPPALAIEAAVIRSSGGGPPYRAALLSVAGSALLHAVLAAVLLAAPWSPPVLPPPVIVELVAVEQTAPMTDVALSSEPATHHPASPSRGEQMPPASPVAPSPAKEEAAPPEAVAEPVAADFHAELAPLPTPRPKPPSTTPATARHRLAAARRPDAAATNPEPRIEPATAAPAPAEHRTEAAAAEPFASSVPASAGKPAAASAPSLAVYRQEVLRRLAQAKRYPGDALARGEQGWAVVRIVLDRDGAVVGWTLIDGTGSARLDREVAALVERAAPYPPLPSGFEQNTVELVAPIEFTLK